jgi:hypothetical protein
MKNFSQWKTTLIGFFALVIPVLVGIGWISADKAGPLGENVSVLIEGIFVVAGSVAAIVAIFKTNDDG